jgi:hypothetical protein
MVIKPAPKFLVKVITLNTMAPNRSMLGKITIPYICKNANGLNGPSNSGLTPGSNGAIIKPKPNIKNMAKVTTIELRNLAGMYSDFLNG